MKIRQILVAMAMAQAAALGTPAHAAVPTTSYDLVLTIDSIDQRFPCNPGAPGRNSFGCLSVGQSFSGRFAVDSSILGVDGLNRSAAIYDFFLPFGNAIYSNGPDNLTLRGFRNPAIGAAAPGFLIQGGQVVDWFGGVYGSADVPFIDMFGSPSVSRNRFRAYDGPTAAYGTLAIAAAVPEPETYAMMAIGLGALAYAVRRRRSAAPA